MKYQETKPCNPLKDHIHSFWELKGEENDGGWERIFPDGCPGLVVNLGDSCITDNGAIAMEYGKTYAVGAMTTFKESFVDENTHLVGVCFKPSAFSSFYIYASLNDLKDQTVLFDQNLSFDKDKLYDENHDAYLNRFLVERMNRKYNRIVSLLQDIHDSKGCLSIDELSKENHISKRQVERIFKDSVGLTPKEYSKIIRFQSALSLIQSSAKRRSLLDIAFECGYYDHSHLNREIKRITGLLPSRL
ncbi:AraC family transcriptional regulator [Echinicola marina]|uniref:helix-turn-helix domain-containing protein n=1 Tax=Echinicola marina TaxID=2859768 RepID=UPI001CF6C4C9|nr:AraC family transcriptional regulator [Echinicola marina]UCS94950.1 AraC family transcriptional regulator [Echinicola marina]